MVHLLESDTTNATNFPTGRLQPRTLCREYSMFTVWSHLLPGSDQLVDVQCYLMHNRPSPTASAQTVTVRRAVQHSSTARGPVNTVSPGDSIGSSVYDWRKHSRAVAAKAFSNACATATVLLLRPSISGPCSVVNPISLTSRGPGSRDTPGLLIAASFSTE